MLWCLTLRFVTLMGGLRGWGKHVHEPCRSVSTTSPIGALQKLLESSPEPLSFIVFIPEWRDPPTPALTRMERSRFKRHQLVLPAFDHEYRSGSQHICKKWVHFVGNGAGGGASTVRCRVRRPRAAGTEWPICLPGKSSTIRQSIIRLCCSCRMILALPSGSQRQQGCRS